MGSGVVWARISGVAAGVIVAGLPVAAAGAVASPGPAGPYPVRAAATPGLCWQAAGNGSAVTLERCDQAIQGQQWTLTGDGVFMNGNGYCLEAGTGDRLYLGFDGQCGGAAASQLWAFSGGQLRSRAAAVCAAPAGPLAPGTAIVAGACGRAQWSVGTSAAAPLAPTARPRPVTAGPATQPSVKPGRAARTAAAEPAAGQASGQQAVLMTVGLVLFGVLLVLVGRRRGGQRSGEAGGAGDAERAERADRGQAALDDSGPYVVDVTKEVRRRAAQGVDSRPTEPFDVSSTF